MSRLVVHNAILECTDGANTAVLTIPYSPDEAGGQPSASIFDTAPGININNFGFCRLILQQCAPITPGPWTDLGTSVVNVRPALVEGSTLACMHGGTISIVSPGQSTVEVYAPGEEPVFGPPAQEPAAPGGGFEVGGCAAAACASEFCPSEIFCAGDFCGAATTGVGGACAGAACGAANCPADACAGAACGADACYAAACAGAVCGAAGCLAAACGLDACGIDLTPIDACATNACGLDVIPIVPGI